MAITNGMELEGGEGLQQDDPELCLEEADEYNFPGIEDPEDHSLLDLKVAELWMPSWVASDAIMDDVIMALRQKELELRKGQEMMPGKASSSAW
ncbi:hypothetical protein EDB19DRAFT_1914400 [Suillus lakei]|nr:hypothetical protein EDB19DRAFT_1914400 [Suillus lakei]